MTKFFQWARLENAFQQVVPCLTVTIQIVFWATVMGCVLGLILSQIMIRKVPVLQRITRLFISFIRDTPLLVQMMLCYYGFPAFLGLIGIDANRWDKLIFAFIAYGLNQAGFLAEMFRGATEAIPIEQTEAALSVGLTRFQTFRRIIFPQMLRIVLPAFGNDFVGLFQGTSLVYLLGVMDVMGRARSVGTSSGHFLEPYLAALVLYIVISIILTFLFWILNRKVERR